MIVKCLDISFLSRDRFVGWAHWVHPKKSRGTPSRPDPWGFAGNMEVRVEVGPRRGDAPRADRVGQAGNDKVGESAHLGWAVVADGKSPDWGYTVGSIPLSGDGRQFDGIDSVSDTIAIAFVIGDRESRRGALIEYVVSSRQ